VKLEEHVRASATEKIAEGLCTIFAMSERTKVSLVGSFVNEGGIARLRRLARKSQAISIMGDN
jgi:hypothetical protein